MSEFYIMILLDHFTFDEIDYRVILLIDSMSELLRQKADIIQLFS